MPFPIQITHRQCFYGTADLNSCNNLFPTNVFCVFMYIYTCVCVLMVSARESVFHSGYFPGIFPFLLLFFLLLCCTVLLEDLVCCLFIFSLKVDQFLLVCFQYWIGDTSQSKFGLVFIYFMLCWLLFLHWLVFYLFIVHSVRCAYFYYMIVFWLVVVLCWYVFAFFGYDACVFNSFVAL